MANANMDGLPPEMQARIQQIIEGAKQKAAAPQAPAPQPAVAPAEPPAPKPPNLMDHVIMLRQEVAQMRNELHAVAQVTDAVGQAVGQLYAMFQTQTEPTTASAAFQTQGQYEEYEQDPDY